MKSPSTDVTPKKEEMASLEDSVTVIKDEKAKPAVVDDHVAKDVGPKKDEKVKLDEKPTKAADGASKAADSP